METKPEMKEDIARHLSHLTLAKLRGHLRRKSASNAWKRLVQAEIDSRKQ